ncbi:MAG: hypothetical protein AAFX85_13890 [Pseudomonadota bacterium]
MSEKALVLAITTADHLVACGEHEAAASVLQCYVDAYSPHAGILQRLGRVRLSQGRSAEAAQHLEEALALTAASPARCEPSQRAG